MIDQQPHLEVDFPGIVRPLVLASASPRRHELLTALGATFSIVVTDAEERDTPVPPELIAALPQAEVPLSQHPTLLAWRKATAAALTSDPATVILAADTVVVIDGEVLNKPLDDRHAQTMLQRLAGRTHTVYTGLCLLEAGSLTARPQQLALVQAQVSFHPLAATTIAAYVATGEPRDKAGAYGLQGMGARLVREVCGSYTAVVGLPITETHALLQAAGINGLREPHATYRRWLESQGKEPLPCPPTRP